MFSPIWIQFVDSIVSYFSSVWSICFSAQIRFCTVSCRKISVRHSSMFFVVVTRNVEFYKRTIEVALGRWIRRSSEVRAFPEILSCLHWRLVWTREDLVRRRKIKPNKFDDWPSRKILSSIWNWNEENHFSSRFTVCRMQKRIYFDRGRSTINGSAINSIWTISLFLCWKILFSFEKFANKKKKIRAKTFFFRINDAINESIPDENVWHQRIRLGGRTKENCHFSNYTSMIHERERFSSRSSGEFLVWTIDRETWTFRRHFHLGPNDVFLSAFNMIDGDSL